MRETITIRINKIIDDPHPLSCLGMAPNPEHRRLGSGGSSKGPSMCPASISFLRDLSMMVGCCNAELRCLALAAN